MSAIAKARPLNHLDSTTLTVTDSLRDTFSYDDEEYGLDPAIANAAKKVPQNKKRTGWIIAGAIMIFILGLSIGLATRSNGKKTTAASTSAVPEPSTPIEETTLIEVAAVPKPSEPSVPAIYLDVNGEAISLSSDDISDDHPIFEPVQPIGNSALLNQHSSELITSSTSPPSSSSTNTPVLSEPANNVIESPTMNLSTSPSASPSTKPTPEPTESPTDKPTNPPSNSPTSKPTLGPTKSPTSSPIVPLDMSSWASFNWSGETPAPSNSPSISPTPNPTNEPTPAPTNVPTESPTTGAPTESPVVKNPYFMGDEFYTFSQDGVSIDVSTGLTVRVIAQTGSKVQLDDGGESKDSWHTATDAAGIISMNPDDPLNSGYVYLSNSEEGDGDGGVYGLYFDKDGNILEYTSLLKGTTDNCGGGHTPWNTWISCEEYSDGQCWQIDPISRQAKETELGGSGGRYESVAVDNRSPENPVFFTTEDDEEGALRRFVANGSGWDALHSDGDHSFLNILDDSTFEWTEDLDVGRGSAKKYFPNTEGIQVHEGKVYFMAKKIQRLLILDLETNTYTTEDTGKKFYGEGDFGDQPDQNLFGPTRKYMYFTEDGGTNPGVYARYGTDGTYFTMFQGNLDEEDETVGIALSPDHKAFYAALQWHGMVFEFRRQDGLAFE